MSEPVSKTANHRQHDRINASVEITMTSEHNFFSGFTQDISEGGVFIASHEVMEVGTKLQFELKLGKGTLVCEGEVCWVREPSEYLDGVVPGMGVRFLDLPENVATAINNFIQERREAIFYDDDPF
jgi:uncharacterized protein (TIGR02266 family)